MSFQTKNYDEYAIRQIKFQILTINMWASNVAIEFKTSFLTLSMLGSGRILLSFTISTKRM